MANNKPSAKKSWADVSGLTFKDYERAGVLDHHLTNSMVSAHGAARAFPLITKMGGSVPSKEPTARQIQDVAAFNEIRMKHFGIK